MKKSIIALLTLPLLLSSYGGMWEPYQMPSLKKELRDAGFYKNVESISNPFEYPMNAIVSLGYVSSFYFARRVNCNELPCVERDFIQLIHL